MGTYTAKTRTVGRRPRSKRLRELGGTVINNSGQAPDLSPYELLSNKVTEVDQNSTDEQYPTAKLLYDLYAALGALITALDEGKQDAISDLAAIRSGAALGATALQAITAAAGSDIGTVGTPSVTVSTQGSSTTLTFHQLKGAKGDKGDKGDTGATGPQGPAGAGATVDSALSDSSTNPVQNKVVKAALDGKVDFYGNITSIGQSSPASGAKTFLESSAVKDYSTGLAYNNAGSEVTLIFGRGGSANYGNILKIGYADTYLRLLRKQGGSWKSDDWEKISAGDSDKLGGYSHSDFLKIIGGTLTGLLRIKSGIGIENDTGAGMLVWGPASGWTGVGQTQWAVGALDKQGVIRSDNNPLLHYRNSALWAILDSYNYSSYALPLTGGTISDTAITTAKTVLDVVAGVSSPSTSNNVYGIKATLTQTGSNVNTNSAAIYGVASAGYAGLFSGMVKVSSTLTANSVSAATVYQTSDDRLKDYVGDFHFALADIDKIPLRFFTFKDDPDKRVLIGTSAQAVQKVLPEIVGSSRTASEEDSEEYLNVDYSKLALVALDCVHQLRDEVAALRAEIKELKRGR